MASEQLQRIRDRNLTPSQVIHEVHMANALSQLTDDEAEEILVHYGVKGMRWGIRRPVGTDGLVGGPGTGSGGSSRAKKAASATGRGTVKAVKATGRGVKKLTGRGKKKESQSRDTRSDKEKRESNLTGMTTKQLQDRINRLELEKRYKSLSVELKPPAPKRTKTKGVKVRNLTDVELRAYVDRLNLEKQYSQLTTPPAAQKKQKQKSAVRKFLVEIGGKQLKRQANAVLNAKIDPIVADAFKLTADAQKKAAEEDKKK